jgi:hypothetical protein
MVAAKDEEEVAVVKKKVAEADHVFDYRLMDISVDRFLHGCYLPFHNKIFPESHMAINLARELQNIISNWNLKDKVVCIVADNAANIKQVVLWCIQE